MIPVIDLHADTYYKKLFATLFAANIQEFGGEAKYSVSEENLRKGGVKVQVQSLFLDDGFLINPLQSALKMVYQIKKDIKNSNRLFQVFSHEDIEFNLDNEEIGILISLEGLEPLVNDLDLLYIFHELGVRIAGLTWNRLTPFVSPFFEESGVFSRGWDLFKTINELHLITDFSHSSEKTFFQATEKLTCPIIASHSNCYTLNPVKRNLKDDQIKLIQERKGVIGINFAPIFLETDSKLSSFELIYNQIDYLASKFSSDIIAFGSDFDGLDEYLSGIENPSFFQDFGAYLVTRGVSSEDINKIFYQNFLKLFSC